MREAGFVWSEIAKYAGPAKLDSLVHFVTYKCNARCSHCFFAAELNRKEELSTDEILRIIDNLGPLKGLLISGGEPFLRDDLAQIVTEYERKCGVVVASIPTNGFNTDQVIAGCEAILGSCKDLNLTIAVSIDGLFDAHDKARNFPGGFARAADTIRKVISLKAKYPRLRSHVVTVIMRDNIDSLREISKFVREEMAPDYHWFEPVRQADQADLLARISRDELRSFLKENIIYYFKRVKGSSDNIYSSKALNKAITNFALNNIEIALANFFDGKKWPVGCVAGKRIAVLYPDGSVSACELRPPAGNVRDTGYDLTSLLKSPAFRKEAREIAGKRCSCFHGCFIPPSVRFSPLYMGRLALKTAFTKH